VEKASLKGLKNSDAKNEVPYIKRPRKGAAGKRALIGTGWGKEKTKIVKPPDLPPGRFLSRHGENRERN